MCSRQASLKTFSFHPLGDEFNKWHWHQSWPGGQNFLWGGSISPSPVPAGDPPVSQVWWEPVFRRRAGQSTQVVLRKWAWKWRWSHSAHTQPERKGPLPFPLPRSLYSTNIYCVFGTQGPGATRQGHCPVQASLLAVLASQTPGTCHCLQLQFCVPYKGYWAFHACLKIFSFWNNFRLTEVTQIAQIIDVHSSLWFPQF